MRLSEQGIEFLEWWEGFRPTMYLDISGLPTIGFGHLIGPGEQHLLTATLTRAQARELLIQDSERYAQAVDEAIDVPLTQAQFDALTALCYNIGIANFSRSTVVARINSGDTRANITEAWAWWNKFTNPATGAKEVSKGLANRRAAEIAVYLRGDYRDWKRNLAEGAQLLTVVAFLAIGTYVLVKTAQA